MHGRSLPKGWYLDLVATGKWEFEPALYTSLLEFIREETPSTPCLGLQTMQSRIHGMIVKKIGTDLQKPERHRLTQLVTGVIEKRRIRQSEFRKRFLLGQGEREARIGVLRSIGKIRRHTKRKTQLTALASGYTIRCYPEATLMNIPNQRTDPWISTWGNRPPGFIPLYQMDKLGGNYIQVAGVWLAERRALRSGHIIVSPRKKVEVYMSSELL